MNCRSLALRNKYPPCRSARFAPRPPRRFAASDRETAANTTQRALEHPVSNPATVAEVPPPPATWRFDHSGASGSTQVIAVQPRSSGGECKMVHQIAYIQGNEVQQNTRYCQSPNGSWTQA